uniref:Uncharacterized protein n=1 Tax=Mola mola TaxID=94237 RepID=A0A3Q3XHL0_MOLML
IMAAPLGRDTLPDYWSYGVCRDGRVFFINDKSHSTTWLHPRTGEPVNSGHMIRSDLPKGWEEGFTDEGASYFINHNLRATSFRHPVTGQISPENTEYTLQDRIESPMSKSAVNQRSPIMVTELSSLANPSPYDPLVSLLQSSRGTGKVHSFGKRDHAIKRNLSIPVVVRGWLYKQDSSGMRLWKRKWFVLSDYCLFYYKDSREETVLGSIPLPSYVIAPVEPDDHINRKYAFKATHTGMRSYIYNRNSVIGSQAEHCGMRTYFFSADTQEDMNGWIQAMNQAALMQQSHTIKRWQKKAGQQAVPQTNHIQVQRRPIHFATEERVERCSPDPADGAIHKNGQQTVVQVTLPPEQNDNLVYQRSFVSRTNTEKHVQKKNTLAEVEQWVKVQKGDPPKSPKPAQWMSPISHCQSLSAPHLAATLHQPTCPVTTSMPMIGSATSACPLQLYEWQQRQQFRHGSPTAPIYTGPNFTDSSSFRVTLEMPRSISVPPSPCEVPPSFKPMSPHRPHTPSERRTVKPLDEMIPGDSTRSSSPGHMCSSQIERRSMPAMGYITHTVSAPTLHGKTVGSSFLHLPHYLIELFKVTGRESLKPERPSRPVKIAESDADVKLSRLCEQDKILQELEATIGTLKEDKDKLESVLDVSHQQMEQYRDQPAHVEKIAYQQKLLQEDVVQIRAEISKVSTEMENAWNEYSRLERDVDWLKSALQAQMNRSDLSQQEKIQIRKELWRIEDVIAGLSTTKANYKVTIASVTNPERKFVPSVPASSVPSVSETPSSVEMRLSQQHSPHLSPSRHTPALSSNASQQSLCHFATTSGVKGVSDLFQCLSFSLTAFFVQGEDDVPPRPPLPQLYSPDEHPPAVPPLPRESTVIRHTSVRGLKRQSDERKRDREICQYSNGDSKAELRPFLSDPELMGAGDGSSHISGITCGRDGYQTLPSRGAAGSSLRLNQSSSIASYVTLRRPTSSAKRPKSALERLYSGDPAQHQRSKMSADEQLERMKRHQKALVRQRKRTLSHGDRHASPSSRTSSSSRPLSADLGSVCH